MKFKAKGFKIKPLNNFDNCVFIFLYYYKPITSICISFRFSHI